MYRSSVDALTRLLERIDDFGQPMEVSEVTSVSSLIRTLKNGIRHCSIQVQFASGSEYKIEAFGDEADELHVRASGHPAFEILTV